MHDVLKKIVSTTLFAVLGRYEVSTLWCPRPIGDSWGSEVKEWYKRYPRSLYILVNACGADNFWHICCV